MPDTSTITLTLAHSPDSDDLVMWWPLTGITNPDGSPIDGPLGKPQLDTGPFRFNLVARDVEELNQLAIEPGTSAPYDITAISCAAYPAIADRYLITRSGGSFGENYGPKVVTRTDSPLNSLDDLTQDTHIAIPGINTSAFLTLNLIAPGFKHTPMLFSDIPDAVANGQADAGLLIHEAQLTFEDSGLKQIGDIGQWWHTNTKADGQAKPLPLGLNVIARSLDTRFGQGTCQQLADLLTASIETAVREKEASRLHLQINKGDRTEWDDPKLVDKYLSMYVSDLTLDMGQAGKDAITLLLSRGADAGLCKSLDTIEII
ncbi:MAG: menaquinone biosynthesis family protein [Phycisphaerales bacterium]